jgi:hypothetical protein
MTDLEAAVANGVTQQAAGKQSGDEEQRRNLAENYMIMADNNLDSLLQGMSKYTWTDTEGSIGAKDQSYTGAIPKNVAMAILGTHLLRTGYVDEKEARIAKLKAHRLFIRRKMKMTEQEFEEGGALVVDAINMVVDWNIDGSINGRVTKMVKMKSQNYEVRVGPPEKGLPR